MSLSEHGVPDELVSLIMRIYNSASCKVKGESGVSSSFPIQRGVLQGDISSPLVFIVVLDSIFRRVPPPADEGEDLGYADDVALIEPLLTRLVSRLEALDTESKRATMFISELKTKVQRIRRPVKVSPTSEGDCSVFKYPCKRCGRPFPLDRSR